MFVFTRVFSARYRDCWVPLAVAVLAPVIVNILVFHALMAPSGLPLALFVAVLWAVIFVDVRPAFAPLFESRLQARARPGISTID